MNTQELQKERSRAKMRKYRYGITDEQYKAMLAEQNNACAVCRLEFSDRFRPSVDHDHNCCSGTKSCGNCLRGLLCAHCLTLASIMETRFEYMNDMFLYLTKYLTQMGGEK